MTGGEIIFDTLTSISNVLIGVENNTCLTKIDTMGKLNVYHSYDVLLPLKLEGYWTVHDEISGLLKQGQINLAKFDIHDAEII
jgi:hypothetical protein